MSFSCEFNATRTDAEKIIAQEHMPLPIHVFVTQALMAFKPDELVFVKAVGHLYNNDHEQSTGALVVQRVPIRKPQS